VTPAGALFGVAAALMFMAAVEFAMSVRADNLAADCNPGSPQELKLLREGDRHLRRLGVWITGSLAVGVLAAVVWTVSA